MNMPLHRSLVLAPAFVLSLSGCQTVRQADTATDGSPAESKGAMVRGAVKSPLTVSPAKNVTLTSFVADTAYVLNPETRMFDRTEYEWAVVSPDRKRAAVLEPRAQGGHARRLGILDLLAHSVQWIGVPKPIFAPLWSPDGTRIVASTREGTEDPSGFVLVDVRSGAVSLAQGPRATQPACMDYYFQGWFQWSADGTELLTSAWDGSAGPGCRYRVQFHRPDGSLVRSLQGAGPIGTLNSHGSSLFSPSGRLLTVSAEKTGVEVVDARTGRQVARLGKEFNVVYAWYDEEHLIVERDFSDGSHGAVISALDGKVEQVLLTAKSGEPLPGLYFSPSAP